MKFKNTLAAFLSLSLAAPCGARPPQVGAGEAMGVDPYVADFQKEMASVKAAMIAMGVAIEAIKIPPGTRSGALAAKAAIAAEFAGMAGLEARAEAARLKMVEHINGIKHNDGLKFGKTAKSADFGSKKDDSSLKPKDDRTFRGAGPSQSTDGTRLTASASSVRPALHLTNSPLSYNSNAGGSPAVGFSAGMPMPTPGGGATDTGAIGAGMTAAAPITGGGSSGSTGGGGVGGGAPAASGASLGNEAAAGANPDPKSLSKNTSDVAAKAEAARKEAAEKKKADAEQKAQEEKQKQQQLMQMMMQGVTQAVQAVSQAAQQTKQKDQAANSQADSAAAAAPPAS